MGFVGANDLPAAGRLMALDVGARTVGLAVADPSRRVATPVGAVRRDRRFGPTADALLHAFDEYGVGALVVGLPLNLDGSEGPRAQSVRQFARNLSERRTLPTVLWDERFSTNAVEREMLAADASRRRRRARKDELAAVFILQGFLGYLSTLSRAGESHMPAFPTSC